MDNLASEHHELYAEHGLSFWIQTNDASMLFDFGSSKTTLQNAKKLLIDFSELDFAICSHSHYDHCGGFPDFLGVKTIQNLITGPGFFDSKYSFDGTKYTYLGAGFDMQLLQTNKISHQICSDMIKLSDGCYVIGNFNRTHPMEIIPKRFVRQTADNFVSDSFDDEICLALETQKGLVVVVGCSHPGILNILQTVLDKLRQPIYAVIGGTHLMEANDERIQYSVSEMKKMGLKLLALSHCSGDTVQKIIKADTDVASCHLAVGESIIL